MNILVFGKDGQLGKAFQAELKKPHYSAGNSVRFIGRSDCDLSDPQQLFATLEQCNPQLIINAAAYTAVDKAEAEVDTAFAINALAPEVMAQYATNQGATLLHFSTDYVFDGSKQAAYVETDSTNPLGIYGKSKEAGERAIANSFAKSERGRYAILRTSWVYGDGSNFIRTILRLAKERSELRVIHDQHGVPTCAQWLADIALHLVLDDAGTIRPFTSGIYHAVSPGETTWYGLACHAIESAWSSGVQLSTAPDAIQPIPATEYPLPAPRPMNSRLSTQKLQSELERLNLVSKLPHWNASWEEQVARYVKQLLAD